MKIQYKTPLGVKHSLFLLSLDLLMDPDLGSHILQYLVPVGL